MGDSQWKDYEVAQTFICAGESAAVIGHINAGGTRGWAAALWTQPLLSHARMRLPQSGFVQVGLCRVLRIDQIRLSIEVELARGPNVREGLRPPAGGKDALSQACDQIQIRKQPDIAINVRTAVGTEENIPDFVNSRSIGHHDFFEKLPLAGVDVQSEHPD